LVNVVCTTAFVTSMSGDEPTTVIDSDTAPTLIARLSVEVKPAVS
jgi:hypothetical protein